MDLDLFVETVFAAALRGIGLLVRRIRGKRAERGGRTVSVALPPDTGPVAVVVVVIVPATPPALDAEADEEDAA